MKNNQKFLASIQNAATGKCSLCYTSRTLSASFNKQNLQKDCKTLKIYHQITCKRSSIIYSLEYIIVKIQYAGKFEKLFNIRLNSHRKDIKNPNAIEACKHFNTFSKHEKSTLIELLRKTFRKTSKLRLRLFVKNFKCQKF